MLSTIKRVFGTASRISRDEGVGDLSLAVREWLAVRPKYVKFDGCIFVLRTISSPALKLLLVHGEYEGFERRAVRRYVRPDSPVVELGGCLGVIACITNRLLRNGIPHVVVEANPQVIPLIGRNRALNDCNFEIVNAAIAYARPSVTFCPSLELPSNSLRETNGPHLVTVATTRLGDILSQRRIDSFTLICDIEGHEFDLVQHEADVLKRAEVIILETHARMIGEEKTSELMNRLKEIGFQKIDEEATVVVLRRPT